MPAEQMTSYEKALNLRDLIHATRFIVEETLPMDRPDSPLSGLLNVALEIADSLRAELGRDV